MNFYEEYNNRPQRPFTLAARQSCEAAKRDINAPRESFSHALDTLLKGMDARSHEDQYDAVRGIARAWEDTMPDQMMRIAYQFVNLIRQPWFGYDHVPALLDVAEKFGAFAAAHDNYEALNVVRFAFMRAPFRLETLGYVVQRGAENAARAPRREAPAVLGLAA